MDSETQSQPSPPDSSSTYSMQDVQLSSAASVPGAASQATSQPRSKTLSGSSAGPSRTRKPPESITPNACTVCQKARAKCNGGKPACQRCVDRNAAAGCHYEIHAKTAKEQLIREIQILHRRTEDLEEKNEGLEERNKRIEKVMESLKKNGQGPEIISRLKRGDSLESIADWLHDSSSKEPEPMSPDTQRKFSKMLEEYQENSSVRYWTNASRDPALISHLIRLYLSWVHPVHVLFDEDRFKEGLLSRSEDYCSSALVNVVCAMGCHFLSGTYEGELKPRESAAAIRSRFMEEARFHIRDSSEHSKTTTIQTFAIMFLVELGSGNGARASSHLRLAVENLLAKKTPKQLSESGEMSTWGILTLHTAWSGFIYQKPSAPVSTRADALLHLIQFDKEEVWTPYTTNAEDMDLDDTASDRAGHITKSALALVTLFRIVHETILVYCGSRGKATTRQLLSLYERYLMWREALPQEIAEMGQEPLPHVLFLHIQYHTALVHFLQPLLHGRFEDQAAYYSLRDHVHRHAIAGLHLLSRHRTLYTSHFVTPLHAFCLVHICDALIRYTLTSSERPHNSPPQSEVVNFCLETLEEMRGDYPIALALQAMFRISLNELGVPFSTDQEAILEASAQLGLHNLLDACTRPTYRQPTLQILTNMEDGIAQTFVDEWTRRTMQEKVISRERGDEGRQGNLPGPETDAAATPARGHGSSATKGTKGSGAKASLGGSGSKGKGKGKGKKIEIGSILNG